MPPQSSERGVAPLRSGRRSSDMVSHRFGRLLRSWRCCSAPLGPTLVGHGFWSFVAAPSLRRFRSWDQGKEIAAHEDLAAATGLDISSVTVRVRGRAEPTRTPTGSFANGGRGRPTSTPSNRSRSTEYKHRSTLIAQRSTPSDPRMAVANQGAGRASNSSPYSMTLTDESRSTSAETLPPNTGRAISCDCIGRNAGDAAQAGQRLPGNCCTELYVYTTFVMYI